MGSREFIALADAIRNHNKTVESRGGNGWTTCMFYESQINTLADFCASQNGRFDRERWLDYISGDGGPMGGQRLWHRS